MKKLAVVAYAAFLAFSAPAFPKGSKGSSGSYYGGGKHSKEHSGTYVGGGESSHKGGTYVNNSTGNACRKHKEANSLLVFPNPGLLYEAPFL